MPVLNKVLSATRTINYSALSCSCLSCIKQQRQVLHNTDLMSPSWLAQVLMKIEKIYLEAFFRSLLANQQENTGRQMGQTKISGAIHSTLTEAAKPALGVEKCRQPDWFRGSANSFEPVLQKRNQLYLRRLGSGHSSDRQNFSKVRSEASHAVRAAKNAWFTSKAEEAQRSRFGGKEVWKCIRDMQYGRRGLVPSRLATVVDEEGKSCTTAEAQQKRWRRHFTNVLNVKSQFNEAEIKKVRQKPLRHQLAEVPTMDELIKATGKLKNVGCFISPNYQSQSPKLVPITKKET